MLTTKIRALDSNDQQGGRRLKEDEEPYKVQAEDGSPFPYLIDDYLS
jgi:hypothetical protein